MATRQRTPFFDFNKTTLEEFLTNLVVLPWARIARLPAEERSQGCGCSQENLQCKQYREGDLEYFLLWRASFSIGSVSPERVPFNLTLKCSIE
ncbi:hypothetical protein AVEN_226208-1 [Araneus ventricosus]|uniref:Uncharacterized protein n=1 Tax=Araneus ventricosus TaxID=182803 RepID=A0A4Y2R512_ARAVE|nr:hypothetical protein AVEN_226208-1 [Araneus ventricosus]